MKKSFVQSQVPVTLVGGAPLESARLQESLALAPCLVAADGGAARALQDGLQPEAVIGDMDSLDAGARARIDSARILEIAEQDTTDFDKCLAQISAPLVVAVGFTGARLDHELAVYNVLARRSPAEAVVFGTHDIAFHAPPTLRLDLPEDSRVSLFPMAAVTGRSRGLRWPIDGIDFAPDGRSGTSNAVSGGPVELEFDGPGMLVILPRTALTQVVRVLSGG
ncbi:thiamine diphosphokinase [Psychromarinibacter halotolerans]|uniref:Thiamine diphosphokinase n=1 Tax=Psychromarinibacter halotolerans TaxID=1775175 RepID=A0ABV7GPT0_9RHOB|nr:thiamine diphosphokinase [Psychromarinibacter halotolerans]MDF0594683.1 thiamine diphosphokinase [Psychromarinibacter halotolerans]